MTTTTEAPVLPDADFEAWLAGEVEQPCEVWLVVDVLKHGIPSEWFVSTRLYCNCSAIRNGFICTKHQDEFESIGAMCSQCGRRAEITWVERVKGGGFDG